STFLNVVPSLQAAHMGIISGFMITDLIHYECWYDWYGASPPPGDTTWCSQATAGTYNSLGPNNLSTNPQDPQYATSLYKFVGDGLSTIVGNTDLQPLVQGFWVLDDQPLSDWGHGLLQSILQQIHAQIASTYAAASLPAPPTICGFAGSIGNTSTTPPTPDIF